MARSADPRRFTVEFRATLPYRLTSLIALLAFAPDFEGYDPHLSLVHTRLDDDLRRDIELLFLPLGEGLIVDRLCAEEPAFDDFAAFAGWLTKTDPENVRDEAISLLEGLDGTCSPRCSVSGSGIAVPPLEDEAALRSLLLELPDPWARQVRESTESLDGMVRLLSNPVEALARLVFVLTRFWEDHGRELDAIDRPIIQRSMSYHERQEYSGTAAEIFLAVTGQAVLGDAFAAMLEKARHLVFIPSCYIGALAMFSVPPGDDETLLVSFNARSTGVNEGSQGEIVSQVFAPLKALADETRLHIVTLLRGRELYAQQIVDQLKQSQSTISRHLNLLVTGGILSTREESGRKYYSIHMPSVERFLEQLHEMTREGEADARGPHAEGETLESART